MEGLVTTAPWGQHPRPIAVLGWPVGHSLSPAMHNAGLRSAGLPAVYLALAVAPAEIGAAVRGLRALGFLGANVTVPHKEAVVPFLDELDPVAAALGAVNTIVVRAGRLIGANTDGAGFIAHLRSAGCEPAGRRAVVLGAGGAARAVAVALVQGGVAALAVLNRTLARAEAVAAVAGAAGAGAGVGSLPVAAVALTEPAAERWLGGADLVVNCTPVGMGADAGSSPLSERGLNLLPAGAAVYDTVYRPAETALLVRARQRGLVGIGGLGMLVHQGALAWEWWFGRPGPLAEMQAAAQAALSE